MLFYKNSSSEYKEQVEEFFVQMNTPVDVEKEAAGSAKGDVRQYKVLSYLCLIYSAAILLLMFIPNEINAKLCILFCGGLIFCIGIILRLIAKRIRVRNFV